MSMSEFRMSECLHIVNTLRGWHLVIVGLLWRICRVIVLCVMKCSNLPYSYICKVDATFLFWIIVFGQRQRWQKKELKAGLLEMVSHKELSTDKSSVSCERRIAEIVGLKQALSIRERDCWIEPTLNEDYAKSDKSNSSAEGASIRNWIVRSRGVRLLAKSCRDESRRRECSWCI